MPSNVVEEWLERWISPEVRLGNRVVSSWFLAGAAGFMAGWILLVVLAAWSGASLGVAVLIGMAAATAAAVGGLVERAVLGRELHGLHPRVVQGFVAAAGVAWAADGPEAVVGWLDRCAPAAAVLLACGRVGCFRVGCCAGRPSSWGVRYPEAETLWRPGRRRIPVQLVEAGYWAAITPLLVTLLVAQAPGASAAAVGVTYGLLRPALEGLRADGGRHPSVWAWSAASVALGIGVAPGPTRAVEVGAAVAFGLAALLLRWRGRRWVAPGRGLDPADAARVREWAGGLRWVPAGPEPALLDAAGLLLAGSRAPDPGGDEVVVSVSGRAAPSRAWAEVVLDEVDLAVGGVPGPRRWVDGILAGSWWLPARTQGGAAPAGAPQGGYFERPEEVGAGGR